MAESVAYGVETNNLGHNMGRSVEAVFLRREDAAAYVEVATRLWLARWPDERYGLYEVTEIPLNPSPPPPPAQP